MSLPLVVIVGADKGGVGKTTVSRLLMDYFRSQGIDARAFDTQVPTGVLKRFFPGKTEMVDLSTVDGQMLVFDTMSGAPVTVLDLAGGLLTPALAMLRKTGFTDLVREGKANIAVLHVVGSSVASIDEVTTIAGSVDGLKLFVISNPVSDAPPVADVLKAAAVITMPKLEDRAVQAVDEASMSFLDFIADETKSRILRGYVRTWANAVFKALDVARFNR